MKETITTLLASIVIIFGLLFYFYIDGFSLDERKILKETRNAYKNVKFEKQVFLKREEIQAFTEFLLRHIDKIKNYNR